jgi:hypothetical protein
LDPTTRGITIKSLRQQLDLCRVQSASLDNNADRRHEMAETIFAIQLLLDFLEREQKNERL